MSTTTMDETAAEAPIADVPPPPLADPAVTTFRGRTLEELLPQIREQLGPDAIVVRQRDGLMGGIGGFFQQRFVEVDAKSGPVRPRIDVYDEQPAPTPESFAALLADAESDGEAGATVTAAAFAPGGRDGFDLQPPALPQPAPSEGGPRVGPAGAGSDPRSSAEPAPFDAQTVALPPASAPTTLDAQETLAPTLTAELTQAGMSASFAARLIQDAEAHELPFARDLREAARRALARRIPTSLPHRAGSLVVAFAGPGSTACADALATAYKRAGRAARAVASLDRAEARLARAEAGGEALLALDLPPIAAERAEVVALAERLDRLTLDEVVAVLPADLDLPSARALLDRLRPLSPTALALDAQGAQLGAAIELACTTRLPLAYIHEVGAIAPADPRTLAERVLP